MMRTLKMKLNISEMKVAILGGLIAQIAFEAYAWLISPFVFGPKLQPAFLVIGLSEQYLGITPSYAVAFSLHALIGIIGFGIFTLLFYKALRGRVMLSGFISGLIFALVFRKQVAKPERYKWETPDYNEDDDLFMQHFDENGNFIEFEPENELELEAVIESTEVEEIRYIFKKSEE